jgi:hypothetical protein
VTGLQVLINDTVSTQITGLNLPYNKDITGIVPERESGRSSIAAVEVLYEGVSRSFRTGRLERELQMLQLSATR